VIATAVVLGLVVLAVGIAAAAVVRLLPTLRLQLSALALLAVCLPLGVVLASGWVMFGMHDDAKVVAVAVASALSALVGALLLAGWILRPLERLRAASGRLAGGDLQARASESGPRELLELGAAFNEMATGVEQLFDARRQLVAWASHDLRTPLASLHAMVEALEDGLASPGEYLPAIHEQLETLSLLVEDLFELARIDAGVLTLELHDAKLGELIQSCLRALDAEARARNIQLEAKLDPADPPVRIAPDKVERVLLNLLTNAVRHTPSDGAVSVIVEPDSDHVVVAVEDTGAGLTPTAARRMFERFWRDDESRARSTGGAGLGLAIAQGLVHAHGGAIWAENKSSGGARVAFTLPLAGAPEPGQARQPRSLVHNRPAAARKETQSPRRASKAEPTASSRAAGSKGSPLPER
jgi:two-component system sensor histidine kinase BaeS